jgi:hypothetical protein
MVSSKKMVGGLTWQCRRRISCGAAAAILSLWMLACPVGVCQNNMMFPNWRQNFCFDDVIVLVQPLRQPGGENGKTVLPSEVDNGPRRTFRVTKVLKGNEHIKVGSAVELAPSPYVKQETAPHAWLAEYRKRSAGKAWWSHAVPLSETGVRYAEFVTGDSLTEKEVETYYRFWMSSDLTIFNDARTNLAERSQLEYWRIRDIVDHDALVQRARDSDLDLMHRRLALQLLAVVPEADDVESLKSIIHTSDADERDMLCPAALEAYISVTGERGLRRIEIEILRNSNSDLHWHVFDALYRHIESQRFISRERGLEAARIVLELPSPSGNYLVHLRRLKDWQSLDRVALVGFDAVRRRRTHCYQSAMCYLFKCPLPEAQQYLDQFKELVPDDYEEIEHRIQPRSRKRPQDVPDR